MLFTVATQSIRPPVFVYPLGIWVLMAVVAVANGVFRELVIVPRVGDSLGHIISTLLLVAAILVLSFLYFTNTSVDYTQLELAAIGGLWMVLTVGFEFLVGYLEGTPPAVTIGQYNVFAGRIWILVPIALLIGPLLFGWDVAR